VYKIRDTLKENPKDLSLEWKLPVDESLAFNIGLSFLPVHLISHNGRDLHCSFIFTE